MTACDTHTISTFVHPPRVATSSFDLFFVLVILVLLLTLSHWCMPYGNNCDLDDLGLESLKNGV
mgnify:CR=1 FL=1